MAMMALHKYHYHGTETIHLPEYEIEAIGGDATKVYETDKVLDHPAFKEVFKQDSKEKESAKSE